MSRFPNKYSEIPQALEPGPVTDAPDTVRLMPLPELLKAYHEARVDISRQRRFGMAAHITSALLQTHVTLALYELVTISSPAVSATSITAPTISPTTRRTFVQHESGRRRSRGNVVRKSPTW
ncbi:hypothetical protein MMC14_004956 [Varicellaria rhodocarpa]|nr:hypothetical protein [Varicellaria rhodocarpa]